MLSRELNVWVGVARVVMVESDPWMDGRDSISISTMSCHVVRTGCSRHS